MVRLSMSAGLILIGLLAGCTIHAEAPVPPPEAVPAGYVAVDYDPVYYDHGWYEGPYWYWHGHDGRVFHERREIREHHEFHHEEHGR